MKINWVAVSTIVAAVGIVVVSINTSREIRTSRFATRVSIAYKLDDRWESDRMLSARARAARALLLKEDDSGDVDDVLDFFDGIGILVNKDVLDPEIAWNNFYYPMVHYWQVSRDHAFSVRRTESGSTWDALEIALQKLTEIERRHPHPMAPPTEQQVKEFLESEQTLTEK